jgi:hypothetical protein
VTEHRIRLRGGWECISLDSPTSEAHRLTLPTRWKSDRPRRLRLIRWFNPPSVAAGTQVVLQLSQVPGIRLLQLNGQPTPIRSSAGSEFEIALDGSGDRHQLILEIETPASDDSVIDASEWGVIALVIRTPRLRDPHATFEDSSL